MSDREDVPESETQPPSLGEERTPAPGRPRRKGKSPQGESKDDKNRPDYPLEMVVGLGVLPRSWSSYETAKNVVQALFCQRVHLRMRLLGTREQGTPKTTMFPHVNTTLTDDMLIISALEMILNDLDEHWTYVSTIGDWVKEDGYSQKVWDQVQDRLFEMASKPQESGIEQEAGRKGKPRLRRTSKHSIAEILNSKHQVYSIANCLQLVVDAAYGATREVTEAESQNTWNSAFRPTRHRLILMEGNRRPDVPEAVVNELGMALIRAAVQKTEDLVFRTPEIPEASNGKYQISLPVELPASFVNFVREMQPALESVPTEALEDASPPKRPWAFIITISHEPRELLQQEDRGHEAPQGGSR